VPYFESSLVSDLEAVYPFAGSESSPSHHVSNRTNTQHKTQTENAKRTHNIFGRLNREFERQFG
jgi:hypothetical protein